MNCNSKSTTKDFFIEKGIFDKHYNILNLSEFRKQVKEWTDFAKNFYNTSIEPIYKEENSGKKAVPNDVAFSKIDGIKAHNAKKQQTEDAIKELDKIDKNIKPTDEQLSEQIRLEQEIKDYDQSTDGLENLYRPSEEVSKIQDNKETLQPERQSNTSEFNSSATGEESTTPLLQASFIYNGQDISDEVRRNTKYLTEIWKNRAGFNGDIGLAISQSIANRIFRGGGFIGQIQQALLKNGVGYKVQIVSNNSAHKFYVVGDTLFIDTKGMEDAIKHFPNKEKYLLWVETTLNEEFYHLVENNLLSEEDVNNIYNELSPEEIKKSEEYYYTQKLDDTTFNKEIAVKEYLRQIWQKEVLGITTENTQPTGLLPSVKKFLAKVFDFIFSKFQEKSEDSHTKTNYNRIKSFIEGNNIPVNYNTSINFLEGSFNIEKASQELEDLESKKLSKLTDEFFTFVQRELRDLTHKGYEQIKKVFENKITKSDFTLLYDQLKQAALKTDEGEGFKKKAEGFALAVDQLELITSKLLDSVKNRDFSTLTNLEKMQELQKYTGFLNEWSNFITELRKDLQGASEILPTIHKIQGNINTTSDLINTINNKAVVAEMGVILEDTLEAQTERFNKGIKRLTTILDRAKANNDTNKVKQTQQLIDKLKAEYKDKAMTSENIAEFLSGNRGDTNALSAFFEAYMSSPDPITYGAKKITKQVIEKARQQTYNTDFSFQQLISPLLKKLGYNPLKPFEFWQQFTQGTKSIDKEGNEYKKLELLNEFNEEWKKDLQIKQKAVKDAEESKDENVIYSAKQDLRKFLRNYMFQQYTDDYYDRFEVWDDEIGKKAFNQRQEIFDKMSDLQLQLDKLEAAGIDYTPEQYQEQENLIFQLRRLSALTDENGKPKTDEALAIAKKHIEYQEKTRDIVDYKERIGAVERARFIFSKGLEAQGIKSDSEEYKRLLDLWDSQNFRQMNTPEFYIDRQKLLNEFNDISSQVKDKLLNFIDKLKSEGKNKEASELEKKVEDVKEFGTTWNSIFDQLKGYRDSDGQPVGTLLTEGKTEEIKSLQEELERIKGNIESLSGLTPNESDELQKIWQNIKINKSVTPEEKTRKEYLEAKRDSLGLSKREKERFYELIQELSAMQTKIPTDYYINQLNSIISSQGEAFTLVSAEELLLDSKKLKELRKNSTFNTWFESNHIQVEKFNPASQHKEKIWQRLYQWNRIVPLDEKYIEKTTLEDGTIIPGKPALKYYYRDVKDKYKTPRIVGITVDNKGNYLPKAYSNSGTLMAKDDTYINKEFFRLKNSTNSEDQTKFELLSAMREYLLKAQENIPYSDRLWLEIPRLEKQFEEIIRTDGLKGVKQHLIDKILYFRNKASQDNEETNVKQRAKTDLFGTELTIIPVKYKGKLNSEDVSLDLPRSIMKYTESTNTKKALMEIHPFIKALENMLEQYGHKDISKIRIAVNKFLNFARKQLNIPIPAQKEDAPISQSNYTRLENIRRLEKRDYQGIYKEGLFLNGRTAFTDALDYYLISPLMSFSGLSILGFDYIGSTVNSLAGNGYKYLDAISNRSFTLKDAIEADKDYVTKIIPALVSDGDQKLGNKSFYGQLIDLFDPQQKISDKLGGKYTSNRALTSLSFLKHALINPRDYGEHQIAITTMLAMLKNVRVEYNGESISIIDAYELDSSGKLQLKAGVNFSDSKLFTEKEKIRQAIREAQGNYAEEDKTEIERYVLGRLLFFFRKYFIPLAMDAWGANRFNGSTGEREGYYITMAKTIKLMSSGLKDNVNNWELISHEEKRATLKGMLFLASTFVFMALIKGLDPDDDKEKWKKTRKWSYAKIQALFLALRVKSEIEQSSFFGGINNTVAIINNPFIITRKFVQLENLADALGYSITGNNKADYSSKGGYDKIMQELYGTKNKALISLYKILGYRGGGLKGMIPGSEEAKAVSAYRLKNTSVFSRKN